MKRTAIAAIIMAIIASCCMGISAKSPTPRKPGTSRTKNKTTIAKIPSDAIKGDFDGDGKQEYVWIEARRGADDFPIGPIRLCSNNPRLNGHKWTKDYYGVWLVNLGKLGSSGRDYLGAIPHGQAGTWLSFETLTNISGSWKPALKPFTIWLDDDNDKRVVKSKRNGYVTIIYNIMNGYDYSNHYKDVKLNY